MTEVICQSKGCIYHKKDGCIRKSVLIDSEGHCMNFEDTIPMYDKGAGESSWHEGLK